MLSRHLSESIYWRINVATIVVFLDKQGVLQDDAAQLANPIRRALEVVLPLRGEYVPLPSFQERELGTVLIPYLVRQTGRLSRRQDRALVVSTSSSPRRADSSEEGSIECAARRRAIGLRQESGFCR